MATDRLKDLHYVVHVFTRPGDPPGQRVSSFASFFPFDRTGGGRFDPSETNLGMEIHSHRDLTREEFRSYLAAVHESADALYDSLEESRMRQALGEDPADPHIRPLTEEEARKLNEDDF